MFYVKAQIPEKKKTVFARFWREDEFHVNGRFVHDLQQATVFPTEDLAAEGLLWFSRFFSSEDLIVLSVEEITRETFDHGDEERAAIAFFASLPDWPFPHGPASPFGGATEAGGPNAGA